jgi:hypothetical protein
MPMSSHESDVSRYQRAVLAAVLAAHGDSLPTSVSVALSDAVDALTDPATLPEYLPPDDPMARDARFAVHLARERLVAAAATGGVRRALACGRAARALAEAQAAWSVTPT